MQQPIGHRTLQPGQPPKIPSALPSHAGMPIIWLQLTRTSLGRQLPNIRGRYSLLATTVYNRQRRTDTLWASTESWYPTIFFLSSQLWTKWMVSSSLSSGMCISGGLVRLCWLSVGFSSCLSSSNPMVTSLTSCLLRTTLCKRTRSQWAQGRNSEKYCR